MDVSKNKYQPRLNQTLLDHIQELRRRLFVTAIAFLLGGTLGYVVHNYIISLLKHPFVGTLYYGTPAGGFNFIMKVCVLAGLMVAIPFFIYNLISFIQPAFNKEVLRKSVKRMTLLSALLASSGLVFAYLVIVPMSLHFFQGFTIAGVKPLVTADSYLTFVVNTLLSFIIIFQIPLIMTFIDRIKPLPPKKMLKYEKYVIVGALAIALILPFTYDPLTQFVVAIPIVVLYNLSIVLIWLAHRRQRKLAPAVFAPIAKQLPVQPRPVAIPLQQAFKQPKLGLIQDISVKPRLHYEI